MELSQAQNVNALIRTGTTSDVPSSNEQAVQKAVREQVSVFDKQPAYQLTLSEVAQALASFGGPQSSVQSLSADQSSTTD